MPTWAEANNVRPCGSSDLEEYWQIRKSDGSTIHHFRNQDKKLRDGGFYYCTKKYETVYTFDLCQKCMVKYGLLW